VHDSVGPGYRPARETHERDAADVLAREGADVRLAREDHSQGGKKIDAYTRWEHDDPGVGTELKSVVEATNVARTMKRDMLAGARQLSATQGRSGGMAGGQVLIDARNHRPSSDDALQACRSAVGQANAHGQILPQRTIVVLNDHEMCVFRPRLQAGEDGTTSYARPDPTSFRHVSRGDADWHDTWRRL
jgi:hypothetical protein